MPRRPQGANPRSKELLAESYGVVFTNIMETTPSPSWYPGTPTARSSMPSPLKSPVASATSSSDETQFPVHDAALGYHISLNQGTHLSPSTFSELSVSTPR